MTSLSAETYLFVWWPALGKHSLRYGGWCSVSAALVFLITLSPVMRHRASSPLTSSAPAMLPPGCSAHASASFCCTFVLAVPSVQSCLLSCQVLHVAHSFFLFETSPFQEALLMVYTSCLTLLPFLPQHLPPLNLVSSLLITLVISVSSPPPH